MSGLLDLALRAHGGFGRWHDVHSLDACVSPTGGLFRRKGYPEGVPDVTVRIDARRPAVTVTPCARPDGRGLFTPDRGRIEDGAGRIVDERNHPGAPPGSWSACLAVGRRIRSRANKEDKPMTEVGWRHDEG